MVIFNAISFWMFYFLNSLYIIISLYITLRNLARLYQERLPEVGKKAKSKVGWLVDRKKRRSHEKAFKKGK